MFRDQFIEEMDSNAILIELLENGIIHGGDREQISATYDPVQRNKKLHLCLRTKCTDDALKTVCDVMIGVQGNPKMKALGEAMKRRLVTSVCMCVCAYVFFSFFCVCVCSHHTSLYSVVTLS